VTGVTTGAGVDHRPTLPCPAQTQPYPP